MNQLFITLKVGVSVANYFMSGIWLLFMSPRGVQLRGHFMTLILRIPYDVEVDSEKQGTFWDTFSCRQASNCGHFSGEISLPDLPGRCYEFIRYDAQSLCCLTRTLFRMLSVDCIQIPLHKYQHFKAHCTNIVCRWPHQYLACPESIDISQ